MRLPAAGLVGIALAYAGCATAPSSPEVWTEPTTRMEFIRIPAGSFEMGSPAGEPGREAQELRHRVTLTRGFWMGRFEVTGEQWARVMGANPSRFADAPNLPVEEVNAIEIGEFLRRLQDLAADELFRLPTEAEWEYACRAGNTTAFSGGESLSTDEANVDGRDPIAGTIPGGFRGRTSPVGSFAANPWGLYDLQGNVWEWTADEHCPYVRGGGGIDGADAAVVDPLGSCGAALRVIRGGSWLFGADSARCALRYTHRPQDRGPSLGFRVVREDPARLP